MKESAKTLSYKKYAFPYNISFELKDLIDGLLQAVSARLSCAVHTLFLIRIFPSQHPAHRTPLHRVLSHPFFNPKLPVMSLDPPPRFKVSPLTTQNVASYSPSSAVVPTLTTCDFRRAPLKRRTAGSVNNGDLRSLLRNEISITQKQSRRVVSDPLPRRLESDYTNPTSMLTPTSSIVKFPSAIGCARQPPVSVPRKQAQTKTLLIERAKVHKVSQQCPPPSHMKENVTAPHKSTVSETSTFRVALSYTS
jgi:hypothetical protein